MRTVDVAVIGAGPAGATLATICARNGLNVSLYEREPGARYRVGESLLPATPRYLARLLGVRERIEQAEFIVKPGATFCWGSSPDEPWSVLFGGPRAGPGAPMALNVERDRFDTILLENAAACGVAVHRGHTAVSVGDGDSVVGREVEVRAPSIGARRRVRARYVANASGQLRLKVPTLDDRTHSRFFRKVAVWGYWDGAGRLDPPLQGQCALRDAGDGARPGLVVVHTAVARAHERGGRRAAGVFGRSAARQAGETEGLAGAVSADRGTA